MIVRQEQRPQRSLQERFASSYLYSANAPFIEAMYENYLLDPDSVEPAWRSCFDDLQGGAAEETRAGDALHAAVVHSIREESRIRSTALIPTPTLSWGINPKQSAITRLVQAYRNLGHLVADINPIPRSEKPRVPDLDPYYQGLVDEDLDRMFKITTIQGLDRASLREVLDLLRAVYTGHIASEYNYMRNGERRLWIRHRLEEARGHPRFSNEEKKTLLRRLTAAEGLERHLHTQYVGQKRFSLEGGESLLPMLDEVVRCCGRHGVQEVVIGMAHRGRLNVLVNLMGKLPRDLFKDFEGADDPAENQQQSGDVKYHQGFSSDIVLESGVMHLALAFNPSHLEVIGPVVEGSARSRQDRRGDWNHNQVVPVIIHGDAAVAGQGVVYETLNLGQTRGFSTGGTLHIVLNNQIGFTTSNPMDTRSTLYCTDLANVVQAPVFHVNGDDPEAVAFVTRLAVDYRMKYNCDVFIDMICYRRHGHNEADEPAVTQPRMYHLIREHPTTRALYAQHLVEEGVLGEAEPEQYLSDYRAVLERDESVSGYAPAGQKSRYVVDWSVFLNRRWTEPGMTRVPVKELQHLGEEITLIPPEFVLHPRVERVIYDRRMMTAGALPIDWGCAETLAYASLLHQGYAVRLTGQDSGRGTFFHRHAVLHDQKTGRSHVPLANLYQGQPMFTVVDSILSEEAVLGFEYGYSTNDPQTLVIWEAQFGDFANVAQVLIDQFISSSEQKWGRLSGLALMLPHGWEGQGPEHSSARLERFLQLCAHENIQVCYPTTPAQMFHMLRREMVRPFRKPLVIMSPKSTLRRKKSFSTLEDLSTGGFQVVMGEQETLVPDEVRRVVLCSGKVYYDLLERRREKEQLDTALLRVEQLYPFPEKELADLLHRFPHARDIVWCQEEPMNQGPWFQIQHHLRHVLLPRQALMYSGRQFSAAPSGGSYKQHLLRQQRLVEAALNLLPDGAQPITVFEPCREGRG